MEDYCAPDDFVNVEDMLAASRRLASSVRGTPSVDPMRGTPSAKPMRGTPSADPMRGTPSAKPMRGTPAADPRANSSHDFAASGIRHRDPDYGNNTHQGYGGKDFSNHDGGSYTMNSSSSPIMKWTSTPSGGARAPSNTDMQTPDRQTPDRHTIDGKTMDRLVMDEQQEASVWSDVVYDGMQEDDSEHVWRLEGVETIRQQLNSLEHENAALASKIERMQLERQLYVLKTNTEAEVRIF
jgi:hypothetical protein